jgi:alkylated DNA repair dioxygenase AlkB
MSDQPRPGSTGRPDRRHQARSSRQPPSTGKPCGVIESGCQPMVAAGLMAHTRGVRMETVMQPALVQAVLFGNEEPRVDPELAGLGRITLTAGAWIDYLPGWVKGHQAVFDVLWHRTRWRHHRRRMYERTVDVPRLLADLPEDGPGHPILDAAGTILSARYGQQLASVSLACYRDGRDSVAWHGDRMGPLVDNTVVAIVSVGAPRRFLVRPAAGGASRAFDLGWGDLLVMGGSCQRTWQHAVPKVARAGPRISIQFRPADAADP